MNGVVLIDHDAPRAQFGLQQQLPRTRAALGDVQWLSLGSPSPDVFRSDRFYLGADRRRRFHVLWCAGRERAIEFPPIPVAICPRKRRTETDAGEAMLAAFYGDASLHDRLAGRPWHTCTAADLPLSSWRQVEAIVWPLGPCSDLVTSADAELSAAMRTVLQRRCLDEFRRSGRLSGNLHAICHLLAAVPEASAAVRWPIEDDDFDVEDLDGIIRPRRLEALLDGARPTRRELAQWRSVVRDRRMALGNYTTATLHRITDGETGEMFIVRHREGPLHLAPYGPYWTVDEARTELLQEHDVALLDSAWA